MATTYNIVEKRYNGTDYDTLYPATKGENLVTAVPLELGGTGGTSGAAGMKNLLDALSTVTPTGTDLLPLKDVSGNIAGKATIDSILSLVSGGAKIQTGSYVGTGTYGQANPCSLTFGFEPKFVCIIMNGDKQFNGGLLVYTGGANMNGISAGNISYTIQNVTVSSSGMEWYATGAMQHNSMEQGLTARHQNNFSNIVYDYLAIG
mgnify:CR=1 FL=1